MIDRTAERARFLQAAGWGKAGLTPLTQDASPRRYDRLHLGGTTAILMDAPPDQKTAQFLAMARYLAGIGLSAPTIYADAARRGLVLMEDLGDGLLARIVTPDNDHTLYRAAVDVLIVLDSAAPPNCLAHFDAQTMTAAIDPLFDWYDQRATGSPDRLRTALYDALTGLAPETNTVLLRDYHAENLLWMPNRASPADIGLLDFQDAMTGPPGYDLASLLTDARRDVPPVLAQAMIAHFAAGTGRDIAAVTRSVAILSVQRNLRILGLFGRLARRDGKTRYLSFVPRVWRYIEAALQTPGLDTLRTAVFETVSAPNMAASEG